jgi:hypothetical protein
MRYRLLTPDEWSRLETILPPEFIPAPETSIVSIAEDDDGKILGVLPLQLQWHLEPLVLLSPRVSFLALKKPLDIQLENFPGSCYYAFVSSGKVAQIAEKMGLKPQPVMVFKGEVA